MALLKYQRSPFLFDKYKYRRKYTTVCGIRLIGYIRGLTNMHVDMFA